ARGCPRGILSPLRLPISPPGQRGRGDSTQVALDRQGERLHSASLSYGDKLLNWQRLALPFAGWCLQKGHVRLLSQRGKSASLARRSSCAARRAVSGQGRGVPSAHRGEWRG